jgi:hypothetical protein
VEGTCHKTDQRSAGVVSVCLIPNSPERGREEEGVGGRKKVDGGRRGDRDVLRKSRRDEEK